MRFRASSLAVTAAALVAPAADAHHSMAKFDSEQEITIEGVVTRYEWANPHVYIYVAETTDAGETVEWEVEGLPPAIMRRQGWDRDLLDTGDVISVHGNPARSAERKSLYLTGLQKADASLFDQETSMGALFAAGGSPDQHTDGLDGVWVTLLAPEMIALFTSPDSLQLTEAGAAAVEAFDEETMHPGANCVPFTAPLMMVTPDVKRIVTDGRVIRIAGEFDGAERTIHMDVDSHEGVEPSIQGHSTGRWEGETLVIDTAAFAEHALGTSMETPSSLQKHLVERLTLNADGASLTYSFELSDPEILAAPVSGEVQWAYRPDLEYAPAACSLENARRYIGE